MKPVINIGDLIVSKMTQRAFVIESEWEDGYYKCRSVNSKSIDDYEYIKEDAIIAYWDNLGPVDECGSTIQVKER